MSEKLEKYKYEYSVANQGIKVAIGDIKKWQQQEETEKGVKFDKDLSDTLWELSSEIKDSVYTDDKYGFLSESETEKTESLHFTRYTKEELEKNNKENIDKVNDLYKSGVADVKADYKSEYNTKITDARVKAGEAIVEAIKSGLERNLEALCKKNQTLSRDLGYKSDEEFIEAVINNDPIFDGVGVDKTKWIPKEKKKYDKKITQIYESVVSGKPGCQLNEDTVKFINSVYVKKDYKADESQIKEEGQRVLRDLYTSTLNKFAESGKLSTKEVNIFKEITGLTYVDKVPSVKEQQMKERAVDEYLNDKIYESIIEDIMADPHCDGNRIKAEKSFDKFKATYLNDPNYLSSAILSIAKANGLDEDDVNNVLAESVVDGKVTAKNWREAGRSIVEKVFYIRQSADSVAFSRKQFTAFNDYINENFFDSYNNAKSIKDTQDKALEESFVDTLYKQVVQPTIFNYGNLESRIIRNFAKSSKIDDPTFWEENFANINYNIAVPLQKYEETCIKYTFANVMGDDFKDKLQEFVLRKDKETLAKENRGLKWVYNTLLGNGKGKVQESSNLLTDKPVREQALAYLDEFVEEQKANSLANICVAVAKNVNVENKVEYAQNLYNSMIERLNNEFEKQLDAYTILANGGGEQEKLMLNSNKEECKRRCLVDVIAITEEMFEDKKPEKQDVKVEEQVEKPTENEEVPTTEKEQNVEEAGDVSNVEIKTAEQETDKESLELAALQNVEQFYAFWDNHYDNIADKIRTRRPSLARFDEILNDEKMIDTLAEFIAEETPEDKKPNNDAVMKWFDESIGNREENAKYLNSVSRTKLFDDRTASENEKLRHVSIELQDRIAKNADMVFAEKKANDETFEFNDLSMEDKADIVFKSKCQLDAKNRLYARVLDKNKKFDELPNPQFNLPVVNRFTPITPKNCIPTSYSSAEAQEKYVKIILDAMERLAPKEIEQELSKSTEVNSDTLKKGESETAEHIDESMIEKHKDSTHKEPTDEKISGETSDTEIEKNPDEAAEKETNEDALSKEKEEMLAGLKVPRGVHDLAVDALYIDMYEHVKNLTMHTRQPDETDEEYAVRSRNAENYRRYIGDRSLDLLKMAAYGEWAFVDEDGKLDKNRVEATYGYGQQMFRKVHEDAIIRKLIEKHERNSEYKMLDASQRKDWIEKNIKNSEDYKTDMAILDMEMEKMFEPDKSKERGILSRRGLMRTVVQDMTNGKFNVSPINLDDNTIKDECVKNTRLYNATKKANFTFDYNSYVKYIQKTIAGADINFKPFEGDNLSNAIWESSRIECFDGSIDTRTPSPEYRKEGVDYGVSRTTLKDGTVVLFDNATKTIIDVDLSTARRSEFLENVVNSVNIEEIELGKNNTTFALDDRNEKGLDGGRSL